MMDSEFGITGPINLGNTDEVTMIELAETVLKLTASKSKLVFMPLPSDDPKQRRPDVTLAKNTLGWQAETHLVKGLEKTIDYFEGLLCD